jgi:CheY-like chemotaxis protein
MQYSHATGVASAPKAVFPGTAAEVVDRQHHGSCSTTQPQPSDGCHARPLRIVLAEDNRDAADTLSMLLEISGHCVWLADTGPAAIDAVRKQSPDVLLCDIGLPGMSGYEVAKTLRQDSRFSRLPMFACTGYADPAHRAAATAAGFDRHFSKASGLLAMLAEIDRLSVRATPEREAQ